MNVSSPRDAVGASRQDPAEISWVECPRDAWQGLPGIIPLDRKRAHLGALLEAGFRHLDLGSFVSSRAVPQMADTEAVLAELPRSPGVDFLCIIGNARGLERALAAPAVTSVGYPLSVSATFQKRNLGMSLEASWELVASLRDGAEAGGLSLVVYLSMGFGNPYGEPWNPEDTAEAVARLRDLGVRRIALADTVGRARASDVESVLARISEPGSVGLHLHARPDRWRELLDAGLAAGVRWFEGALSGVGGCPFADDALVGNLPSEQVLPWLAARGLQPRVDLGALPELARDAADIARRYGVAG